MKRRPVSFDLALILVALLADDVKFIVQYPVVAGLQACAAISSDSPAPITAIRLVDGAGVALEVVRGGQSLCDAAAKSFSARQTPLDLACAGVVLNVGQVSTPASSLVAKHTRLQI